MIIIIWLHFIADFLLQSDTMSTRKSSDLKWLFIHSLIYSSVFILYGIKFFTVILISHFIIDGLTSKIAKYFYLKEIRYWFFVTIGFDQALHLTMFYLLSNT